MFVGDGSSIADAFTGNVQKEIGSQFGLPAGSQIVKQPRPGREPSVSDDPVQWSPQVCIRAAVTGALQIPSQVPLLETQLPGRIEVHGTWESTASHVLDGAPSWGWGR